MRFFCVLLLLHVTGDVSSQGLSGCLFFQVIVKLVWKGRAPKYVKALKHPLQHVVVSHTEGGSCENIPDCSIILQNLQDYNMDVLERFTWCKGDLRSIPRKTRVSFLMLSFLADLLYGALCVQDLFRYLWQPAYLRGLPDISYNFLIGGDGRVYCGRGWHHSGHFSRKYNDRALSVAFIGNYYNEPPPDTMLVTAQRLLECAVHKTHLSFNYTLHAHEDIECTPNNAPALRQLILSWEHYGEKVEDYTYC